MNIECIVIQLKKVRSEGKLSHGTKKNFYNSCLTAELELIFGNLWGIILISKSIIDLKLMDTFHIGGSYFVQQMNTH